jgi:heme O synthase-like polyprenyltransferase
VVTHTITLLAVSLLPAIYGLAGSLYTVGAMTLGAAFLASSVLFVLRKDVAVARGQVVASIIYLPSLLATMLADKFVAI